MKHKRSLARFAAQLNELGEREKQKADAYVKEAIDKVKKATWTN